RLVSDSLTRRLTVREKLNLWLHILMCRPCWNFRALLRRIDTAVQIAARSTGLLPIDRRLSLRSKKRLQAAIGDAIKEED
ncbi:MAG: hypothetical protein KDB27_22780, partial [Planctomycetales bacterium]|nr:hypothetical protein [Planctomycetales bacterium]